MKKIFVSIAMCTAVLLGVNACQKETAETVVPGDGHDVAVCKIDYSATLEQPEKSGQTGSKTYLGGEYYNLVYWYAKDEAKSIEADKIVLLGVGGTGAARHHDILAVKSVNEDDKRSAIFELSEVPQVELEELACAVYPSDCVDYDNTVLTKINEGSTGSLEGVISGTVTVNFPATQTYVENSFSNGANIAVGKEVKTLNPGKTSGKSEIQFRNAFGVLELQLKGDFKVGKIKVSGHNGEKLNGKFKIDLAGIDGKDTFTGAVATADRTDGDDVITLDCTANGGVQLSTETYTTFDIVVPVDAFKDPDEEGNKIGGFTAVIYDVTNAPEFTVLATEKDNTIHRSKIKAMPEMTFDGDTPKFKEVEYLQSAADGKTQIINTNYYTKETVGIFINFKINTKYTGVQCIMGSFKNGDKLSIVKSTDHTNRFNLYFGNDDVDGYVEGDWSKSHKIRVENNYGYIDDKNGKKINSGTIKISGENQLYLFGSATSTTGSGGNPGLKGGYVYSAHITDEGVKVRDFIPCCCVSGKYTDGDGNKPAEAVTTAKPGMLDLVSGNLFINQAEGDFTYGPYVN